MRTQRGHRVWAVRDPYARQSFVFVCDGYGGVGAAGLELALGRFLNPVLTAATVVGGVAHCRQVYRCTQLSVFL